MSDLDNLRNLFSNTTNEQMGVLDASQQNTFDLLRRMRERNDRIGSQQATGLQSSLSNMYGSSNVMGGANAVSDYAKTFYKPETDYNSLINMMQGNAQQKVGLLGQRGQNLANLGMVELQKKWEDEQNKPSTLQQILSGAGGLLSLTGPVGAGLGILGNIAGGLFGGGNSTSGGSSVGKTSNPGTESNPFKWNFSNPWG